MKLPKVFKDPFVIIIAAVIMLPAGLFAYGVLYERSMRQDVNDRSQVTAQTDETTAASAAPVPSTSAPVTQAEQPDATTKVAAAQTRSEVAPASGPVCDQAEKQAAIQTRDSQLAAENDYHEKQKDKLRLISTLYRKYWDDEHARHAAAISQIEATYQAALAASNCQ